MILFHLAWFCLHYTEMPKYIVETISFPCCCNAAWFSSFLHQQQRLWWCIFFVLTPFFRNFTGNIGDCKYFPEIYIQSAPNNSNETYTCMCLCSAGCFCLLLLSMGFYWHQKESFRETWGCFAADFVARSHCNFTRLNPKRISPL